MLGSFPSRASLALGRYYGNERNHFWTLLGACLGEAFPEDYAGRLALLARRRVAVWDAAASCSREGSLDADIREASPNPVAAFLAERTSIRGLAFNGAAAASLFADAWAPELRGLPLGESRDWVLDAATGRTLKVARLPSTSPVPSSRFRAAGDKVGPWKDFLDGVLGTSSVSPDKPR